MTEPEDPLEIAAKVARALEACGIEYYLTGSIASGVMGQPRFTRDIDFVVHLRPAKVSELARALGADFDVDEEALSEAAQRCSSWNIFHLSTMTRIDLFVLKDREYDAEALQRRRQVDLGKGRTLSMLSPEDSILSKLRWFKDGEENDSKQMQDVVDVLRAQRGRLDRPYLDTWAKRLSLESLLDRARVAAHE